MKKLLKITSVIIVWTFLAGNFTYAGEMSFLDSVAEDYLSPSIVVSQTKLKMAFSYFIKMRRLGDSDSLSSVEDYAEAFRLSNNLVIDSAIDDMANTTNEELITDAIAKLYNAVLMKPSIKFTALQLRVLIKVMKANKDYWAESDLNTVLAYALINDNRLFDIFLEQMNDAVNTDSEIGFTKILFILTSKTKSLNLDSFSITQLIGLIEKVKNEKIIPTLTNILVKALSSQPTLATKVIDAIEQALNSDKQKVFSEVLLELIGFKKKKVLKQKDIDRLISFIERTKQDTYSILIIKILTKTLSGDKTLKLSLKQISIIIDSMEKIKITPEIIDVFSEFFTVLFLDNGSLIEKVLPKVKDSLVKIYFIVGVKNASRTRPQLVTSRLLKQIFNNIDFDPLEIVLTNTGSALSLISYVIEALLNSVEHFKLESPVDFPRLRKKTEVFQVSKSSLPFRLDAGNLKNIFVLGRTIVIKENDEYYALKVMKENEPAGLLYYEHEVLEWIEVKKKTGQIDLFNDYPEAVFIETNRVVSMDISQIPEEINRKLHKVAQENGKYKIDCKRNSYTFMCYKVQSKDFFSYLNNPNIDKNRFMEMSKMIIYDLAQFAKIGVLDIALVEFFHNFEQLRRYLWMVDVISPTPGVTFKRSGAGRLHAVDKGMECPNPRCSGLADLAELRAIEWIIRNRVIGDSQQTTKDRKIILASVLGDYLFSWVLMYANWLKKTGKLDENTFESEEDIEEMAEDLKEIFAYLYNEFSPKTDYLQQAVKLVNWKRLAYQIAFYPGGAYRRYIAEGSIPIKVYGDNTKYVLRDKESLLSDGWGFFNIELLPEKIQDQVKKHIIETYLNQLNWMLKGKIYQIIQVADIQKMIAEDKKIPTQYKDELKELLSFYQHGWRYDGINEDLGPFNGVNPLTELITALYLFSGNMVKEFAEERADVKSFALGQAGSLFGLAVVDHFVVSDTADVGQLDFSALNFTSPESSLIGNIFMAIMVFYRVLVSLIIIKGNPLEGAVENRYSIKPEKKPLVPKIEPTEKSTAADNKRQEKYSTYEQEKRKREQLSKVSLKDKAARPALNVLKDQLTISAQAKELSYLTRLIAQSI